MVIQYPSLPDLQPNSFVVAFQRVHIGGGGGIRPIVYGLLDIFSPQAIVARCGGRGTVAGQVLGGGEAGPGDHIAQDGAAEIVPSGGRKASPSYPILQNAMQSFRGQILVQPPQVPPVGNEAEKCPGRLAPDRQPILEIAGGIAHQLGRDRALLVAFPDNAHKVPGRRALRRGDILQGQTGDLMDTRTELPG
jgi:hypothetical protein